VTHPVLSAATSGVGSEDVQQLQLAVYPPSNHFIRRGFINTQMAVFRPAYLVPVVVQKQHRNSKTPSYFRMRTG